MEGFLSDHRQPLPIGHLLQNGRFRIDEFLGSGGFGLAYKATEAGIGTVVIKEFFPYEGADRLGANLRFPFAGPNRRQPTAHVIAEARRQEALDHPSIAKTYWSFGENGTAYISMEWIPGETLLDYAQHGKISEIQVKRIYLSILDAIFYMAKSGLIHRDLNYNNILIKTDGSPIIIDFGLARAAGPGHTTLTRTVAGFSGIMAPEQRNSKTFQDVWTDIYALSASIYTCLLHKQPPDMGNGSLFDIKIRGDDFLLDYSDSLLRCIDKGLLADIRYRLKSGPDALSILSIDNGDQLRDIIGGVLYERTLLRTPFERLRYQVDEMGHVDPGDDRLKFRRFQRALLQSFDTARFQKTSIKSVSSDAFKVASDAKIALARTEAALNILFGREIVVPAGQIAESPAFFTLYNEMMSPFLADFRSRIDLAFDRAGLPPFQPFRLALERKEMVDYVGFAQTYEYTGAPLIITDHIEGASDYETDQKNKIEGFKKLFLSQNYDILEKAVGKDGFADFARSVRSYFTSPTAIFARRDIPPASANEYALVFQRRLNDERVSGAGVSEARASLGLVEEIETKLRESNASGYRGNWYLFAKDFNDVWPLARAYLDTRLFITLSRQYEVDHPILITQELEYGRYDHSLFLGPRFSAEMSEGDRSHLLEISAGMTAPINWSEIFQLFLDPEFIGSVRRMTKFYFSRTTHDEEDYLDAVTRHGEILEKKLNISLSFSRTDGRLTIAAGDEVMSYDSYDQVGRSGKNKIRDQIAAESLLEPFGAHPNDRAAVRTLISNSAGLTHGFGREGAQAILQYYAKPYSLAAREHY